MAGGVSTRWAIPLAAPDVGREEIEAVARVIESGWLTMGPVTTEFERAFAERLGVRHALAVSNGTAALHLANLVLGLGPGDEVICPTLTFVASANASRYVGAEVVLADVIGPHDLTLDPQDVERKITSRTRAITLVHYAGFPCRIDAIVALARRHGLKLIEDCAHAPLAWHEGADGTRRRLGTIGDVGCFSFFGNKNMTTGEGGMVVTHDDSLAERLRLLRSHGMTTLTYDRFRGHAPDYDVAALGYNFRCDDLRSAIGLVQLGKLDRLNERRRTVWRAYADAFADSSVVRVPFAGHKLEDATPHIMSVVVTGDERALRERLSADGIQSSRHYPLLRSFSIYRDARGSTPVADSLCLVTLPFGPHLSTGDLERIAAAAEPRRGRR